MGIEPRVLDILGKFSTTELHSRNTFLFLKKKNLEDEEMVLMLKHLRKNWFPAPTGQFTT